MVKLSRKKNLDDWEVEDDSKTEPKGSNLRVEDSQNPVSGPDLSKELYPLAGTAELGKELFPLEEVTEFTELLPLEKVREITELVPLVEDESTEINCGENSPSSSSSFYTEAMKEILNSDDSDGDPNYINSSDETSDDEILEYSVTPTSRKRLVGNSCQPSAPNNEPTTSHNDLQPTASSNHQQVTSSSNDQPADSSSVRKRKRREDEWQRSIQKTKRNKGESYRSIKVKVCGDEKKKMGMVDRPARKVGPPCGSKCRFKCHEKITPEQRLLIFNAYWNMGDLQRQRDFISRQMTTVKPLYRLVRTNGDEGSRQLNNAFHFEIDGSKKRVCKTFFRSTLAVSERLIKTVVSKGTEIGGALNGELRGKHSNHYHIPEPVIDEVRCFLKAIPRTPSHYCRSDTNKEYIEGGKTIMDLYKDYQQNQYEQFRHSVKYAKFAEIFNGEFNMAFFVPKKDQCAVCVQYDNADEDEKPQLEEQYQNHLSEKTLSRKEKERDKESNNPVIVYDLQAVMPCPNGDISSFYYASKLNVHNFTMFNVQTKQASCYVWHEGEAHRGANEIGTCVWRYLQELSETVVASNQKALDVIFYSDNCGGQNKNRFIFSMYLHAATTLPGINTITHKYLVTGHTQNEGDSVHSVIERNIKKYKKSSAIFVPDQYYTLIRSAKKNGDPYRVIEVSHDDILDLKKLSAEIFTEESRTLKNTDSEVFKSSTVSVMQFRKDAPNVFFYKNSFEEEGFKMVEIITKQLKQTRSRKASVTPAAIELMKAYEKKPGISEAKKNGILSLFKKGVIPKYYFDFFRNL